MRVYQLTEAERAELLNKLRLEELEMQREKDRGRELTVEDIHRRFHYLVSKALS
jgi:hypothetical protein